MILTTIFFHSDEFCKQYEKFIAKKMLRNNLKIKGGRPPRLRLSEIITICVYFHHSGYHTFKRYYKDHICKELKEAFGPLVSYNRFVEIMSESTLALTLFALAQNSKNVTGISFIDSTKLAVCKNLRIYSHKVFKGVAQRGKTSIGWFYGFKLHIVINHLGEILSFWITPGNVDDRNPSVLENITKKLWGLLFGDRGYISKPLFERLFRRGIKLITGIKKNMKNKLFEIKEKLLLRKRNVIESVNNILKNSLKIEHSRHRNISNFFANTVSAIAAYSFNPNKPSICKQFLAKIPSFI